MVKRYLKYIIFPLISLAILAGIFLFVWNLPYIKNLFYIFKSEPVSLGPAASVINIEDDNNSVESIDLSAFETPENLKVPEGFAIVVFAKDLSKPRVMIQDKDGNIIVSQMKAGKITKLVKDENGVLVEKVDILSGLKNPHGLAFDPENYNILYFAEEDKISRVDLSQPQFIPEKIVDLPGGGRHYTRTIGFGPDGRLYVSIGSSCNVCFEKDRRRAAIYVMNKDGSGFEEFAKGLRNTVFFTWNPVDGRMWGTENGRDWLGDDLPPDEINIIEEGGNYGWPICYGKNIHDTDFDKNTYTRNPCMEPFEKPSYIDIPAHSAPLGLDFIPEEGWPEEYRGDLLVALHGSWNRSTPAGYKIIRIKLTDNSEYIGMEDFITGFIDEDEKVYGRPVGILALPGGRVYISDDKAGMIYKVIRVK